MNREFWNGFCLSVCFFFVLSHLVLLHSAEEEGKRENPNCRHFQCGILGNISFPFTEIPPLFPFCGLMQVECDKTPPMIHLPISVLRGWSKRQYEVLNISYTNTAQHIRVKDHLLSDYLKSNTCYYFDNFAFPNSPFISFKLTTPNRTLFKCNYALHITSPRNFKKMTCRFYNIYYSPSNEASQNLSSECSTIQLPLPVNEFSHEDELNLIAEFDLELHISDDCSRCHGEEGKGIDIGITQKCFDAHTHVHS